MVKKICSILQLIGVIGFLFYPLWNASAQCSKDEDCYGTKVCVKDECVEANQSSLPATVTMPPKANGWSTGAGVTGLVLSTVASSFGIVATVTQELTAEISGSISLTILGIDVPICAAGGRSARHNFTDGLPALRILSWVMYAFSLGCGIGMISTGIAGGDVPVGLRIVTVTNGAISGFGMAADALVSGAQVQQTVQNRESTISLSFVPIYKGVKAGVQINFHSIH